MATLIARTTGDATAPFGFRGTDLGYFTQTNHGYVLSTFGDTFDGDRPGTGGWRSPVILRTHNSDLDNGVKWDNAVGGSRAKQVVNYIHQSAANARVREAGGVTQIPNDVVHLPDGRYLLSAFVVRDWSSSGPGDSWITWCNRFYVSNDKHAENWEGTRWRDINTGGAVQFNNDSGGWGKFQNCTLTVIGDYLYMFGTQTGRYKGGGVYLARVKWQDWDKLYSWQFWGWTGSAWKWGTQSPTSIFKTAIPGGAIGEINVQVLSGTVVLSYVDYSLAGGTLVTRTATAPDSVWTAPQAHATQRDIPNLYAPSIHPYSSLESVYCHVSQWNSTIYGSKLWKLDALRVPEIPDNVEAESGSVDDTAVSVCPNSDLTHLSADQLVQVLTSDTSVTPDELREALERAGK